VSTISETFDKVKQDAEDFSVWMISTEDTVTLRDLSVVYTRYWYANQLDGYLSQAEIDILTTQQNADETATNKQAAQDAASTATTQAGEASASAASVNANNILHAIGSGLPNEAYDKAQADALFSLATATLKKSNSNQVMFNTTGSALTLNQDIVVNVNGTILSIAIGTAVTLPGLVSASDYKVYVLNDGSLSAQLFDTAAPANSIEVGGFHVYHTTGTINPSSIWDLKWRPTCSPRGMTLSIDKSIWSDEYMMDTEYGINGYSRGDVTIADGASLPKIPLIFGGDGTATYTRFSQYEAIDLAASAGKRLPTTFEFYSLAYGVVEQQSCGTDPVTTKYQAGYRSACGVEQATGCMWQWGADIQGNTGGGWAAITDGRGSVYHSGCTAVLLGASWSGGANAGSRASYWNNAPSSSNNGLGSRAVCDHLILD